MRSLLEEEIIGSRDVMLLPEYEIERMSAKINAYHFRLNEKEYPVERIYEVASMSGFRDREIAAEQVRLLQSTNKIIRYWAILGLRSQPKKYLMQYEEAIAVAMKDDYPPVAVTAAAIAYDLFNDAAAAEKLKKFCTDENLISVMAINYLLYIEKRHFFVETIRNVQQIKDREYYVRSACMDYLGSLGLVPNTPDYRQ